MLQLNNIFKRREDGLHTVVMHTCTCSIYRITGNIGDQLNLAVGKRLSILNPSNLFYLRVHVCTVGGKYRQI